MFWYIAWYVILEIFSFVPIFCIVAIIPSRKWAKKLEKQENRFLLQPLKLFLWAFITLSVFNISLLTHLSWKIVLVPLLSFIYLLCFIFLFIKFKANKTGGVFVKYFRRNLEQYLDVFVIGLIVFSVLTWLRGLNPDLISTEKPMDFSFIKSFLRQDYIPFVNPWLSNVFLNYYYLGQFWVSILGFLSFFEVPVIYNLVVGLIAALGLQVVYEFFRYYLKGEKKVSLVLSFTVLFSGNMGYLVYILRHFFYSNYSYFYPDPTRIIPHTINEYPAYSVLLADLHGHYLMLPFVWATTIIIIFVIKKLIYILRIIFSKRQIFLKKQKDFEIHIRESLLYMFMLAFLVPFIFAGNSWDILNLLTLTIVMFIIAVVLELRNVTVNRKQGIRKKIIKAFGHIKQLVSNHLGIFIGILGTLALLLLNTLPFLSIYIPPGGKLAIIWPPAISDIKYYPLLWGQIILYALVVLFVLDVFRIIYFKKVGKETLNQTGILHSKKGVFLLDNFNISILMGTALTGIILILLTQFVYVQDIFHIANPPYFRANTLFKIYYTAWYFILLGLFGCFVYIHAIWSGEGGIKSKNKVQLLNNSARALLLLAFVFIGYFVVGIEQRFFNVSKDRVLSKMFKSLDKCYLNGLINDNLWFDSSELDVLNYLGKLNFYSNIIVEPITYDSYSVNAKYCIYAGGQCYIGWPLHNMQWYGGWEGRAFVPKYSNIYIKKNGRSFQISIRDKEQINLQQRVMLVSDVYSNDSYKVTSALQSLVKEYKEPFQTFHFLIYKNSKVVTPDTQASLIYRKLQELSLCKHLGMTKIGPVYDITCE